MNKIPPQQTTKNVVRTTYYVIRFTFFIVLAVVAIGCTQNNTPQFFSPADSGIRITGRTLPMGEDTIRFWQPGVQLEFMFEGDSCDIYLGDEMRWGTNLNYIQLSVDGDSKRLQLKGRRDTLRIGANNEKEQHHVILMKNTEANIGYMDFYGVRTSRLATLPPAPTLKLEFFGNSITCGASSDTSSVPCGAGKWQDQHNAWLAFGPRLGRALNASVHLSSVSGIGLIRSCCDMPILMPQVFDKVDMYGNQLSWDFSKYQPDKLFICLGQNDGIQDSSTFVQAYIGFLDSLNKVYPSSEVLLLSSPMADEKLREWFRRVLPSVVNQMKDRFKNIRYHIFEKQYIGGCDFHPSVEEHEEIAKELLVEFKVVSNK